MGRRWRDCFGYLVGGLSLIDIYTLMFFGFMFKDPRTLSVGCCSQKKSP